uniref:Uncharacterized protein n=1 Tax=Romanomermis culicivorax TaxID=13658 RepID=A0A915KNH8_ROMCU
MNYFKSNSATRYSAKSYSQPDGTVCHPVCNGKWTKNGPPSTSFPQTVYYTIFGWKEFSAAGNSMDAVTLQHKGYSACKTKHIFVQVWMINGDLYVGHFKQTKKTLKQETESEKKKYKKKYYKTKKKQHEHKPKHEQRQIKQKKNKYIEK